MPLDLNELLDPAHTAVVTMELQRGIVGDRAAMRELADEVARQGTLAAAGRLCSAARRAGARVVHCTAEFRADRAGSVANTPMFSALWRNPNHLVAGSEDVQLVPELGPEPGDVVASRRHGISPFGGTSLDATLRNMGVHTVVAAGVSVNLGIIGLVIEAVNHGYRVAVPTDAVAGVPEDYARAMLTNSIALLATLTTVDQLAGIWKG
jgi:nicotinamidase-related amidase